MEHHLPPLNGLLLAGGHSRRMGGDKAAQDYAGQEQLARAYALLVQVTEDTYVSVSQHQSEDPLRGRFPCLVDLWPDSGPMAALATAFRRYPKRAFLVLACDLPLLEAGVLQTLVAARDPIYEAVAYTHRSDGVPEPLCAIYEPQLLARVAIGMHAGRRSLRRSLIDATLRRLPGPEGMSLFNVNTPEERDQALRHLAGTAG